jgi:hypothetical protein
VTAVAAVAAAVEAGSSFPHLQIDPCYLFYTDMLLNLLKRIGI